MDPIAATIIGKALDFVLGETRTILGERRARREREASTEATTYEAANLRGEQGQSEEYETTREEVLQWRLDAVAYQQHYLEIEALLEQIQTHKQNLRRAQGQAAKWGDALVPPIIGNTIEDEERSIINKSALLKKLLEDIYGRKITVKLQDED